MNAKEFDLLSKERIVHAAFAIGAGGDLESPYGARTYGFPTVCRFYPDELMITDYYTDELLVSILYDDIAEAEFSVCSRMASAHMVPYPIFYGRFIVTRKDCRKYVIEFKLSKILQSVKGLLESYEVKVLDKLGIVTATSEFEEERVYSFIESHINEWSELYHIPNPQADDLICRS